MKSDLTHVFVILLFLALLAFLCWYFSSLVIYLLIALALTVAGKPIVNLLCKIRIKKFSFPRPLAAILAMVIIFGLFFGFFAILTPLVSQEVKNLTSIDPQVIADGYDRFLSKFEDIATNQGIDVTATEISEGLVNQLQDFAKRLDIGNILSNMVGIIASVFVAVFAILFLTFFSLSDDGIIMRTARKLIPSKLRPNFSNIVDTTSKQVGCFRPLAPGHLRTLGLPPGHEFLQPLRPPNRRRSGRFPSGNRRVRLQKLPRGRNSPRSARDARRFRGAPHRQGHRAPGIRRERSPRLPAQPHRVHARNKLAQVPERDTKVIRPFALDS